MLLEEACQEAGIPNEIGNGGFGVCDIGETLTVPVDGKMVQQHATSEIIDGEHGGKGVNGAHDVNGVNGTNRTASS